MADNAFAPCLYFDALDSTNEEAKRRARAGERGPLWIVAKEQTKGRGRRGREWVSAPGNLYASCLLAPQTPRAKWAQMSFIAALAVYDAVNALTALGDRLACKWPNDVFLDGKKLAGILLESEQDWLIVGIGINLVHFPEDTQWPASSLKASGCGTFLPKDVMERLCPMMAEWVDIWQSEGFDPARKKWLSRAMGKNKRVKVQLDDDVLQGRFIDLAEDGALVLETDDGAKRLIRAADVFPLEQE